MFVLYRWLHDSTVDDYCYLNEMILAVQCSFSLSSILCACTHTQNTNAGAYVHTYTQTHIHKFAYAPTHTIQQKTLAVKKIWRVWWITAFRQAFLPIFTTSITFPMKMDLNLPKFLLPNCLLSIFAKDFYGKVYTSASIHTHIYTDSSALVQTSLFMYWSVVT